MSKAADDLKKQIYKKSSLLQFLVEGNCPKERIHSTKLELDNLLYRYLKILRWSGLKENSQNQGLKMADL